MTSRIIDLTGVQELGNSGVQTLQLSPLNEFSACDAFVCDCDLTDNTQHYDD